MTRLRPAAATGVLAAVLPAVLALAGCETPQEQCRQQNPASEAAYERCWDALLQRQNEMLDRLREEESRVND